MTAPASSPAALQCEPSSVPSFRVASHDANVSRGPGIVKANKFARLVFSLRTRSGLSIDQAASAWGYARNTIKNWEAGRSEPKWSEWQAIEAAMAERTGT